MRTVEVKLQPIILVQNNKFVRRNVYLAFIIIFLIVFGFFGFQEVKAGASDNVSGYAWSENIGWISFNNTSGGGPTSYGVNVSLSTGKFSGYAWSENIGWITFNRPETGAPPSDDPCQSDSTCIAKLTPLGQIGKSNVDIVGWARALSFGGGWDGWIRFDHDESGEPYIGSNGNLNGWAWGSDVVGWINLKGSLYGGNLNLSGSNQPPNAPGADPSYPDGETWNNCSFGDKSIPTFYWTYSDPDGDPQAAYEVEVDDNSSFNAPKFNHLVNLAATSYALDLSQDDTPDWITDLAWGTTYFWRVRVKDSSGNWSAWTSSNNFQTPPKAYPYPEFNWLPSSPSQGEITVFNPEETGFSYLWAVTLGSGTFEDGTGPTNEEPRIKFSTPNNKVKLTITDSSSPSPARSCVKEKDIAAKPPLPEYKEVPPIIWLKRIMAGFTIFSKFGTL